MSSLSRKAFTADGERTPKLLVFAAAKAKFFSLLKMLCDWLEINLKSSVECNTTASCVAASATQLAVQAHLYVLSRYNVNPYMI